MKISIRNILWLIVIVALITFSFAVATNRANETIDNAQATSAALENSLNELLGITQPPNLSGELATLSAANLTIAAHNSEQMTAAAELQATPEPTVTSTPNFTQTAAPFFTAIVSTSTPTQIPNCYPTDLIEVAAIRIPRVNLWTSALDDIYTDQDGNRIQYSVGETFFVYEDAVETNDGDRFYEVFGPRGNGLFVGESSIKLFDDDPDLLYCN